MTRLRELIQRLEDSMHETFDTIEAIPDEYLDQPCRHQCARGRLVWDLLTHNIEHERLHTGQVVGIRDAIDKLQQNRKAKLLAELYVARATLIASLIGLDDADLNRAPKEGEWNVAEAVEHILYWDRDSIDDLATQYREETAGRGV